VNAFDELDKIIQRWITGKSVINPVVFRRAKGPNYWYRLQFIDESDPESSFGWRSRQFEDCIQWAEKTLATWPDCHRKAFDMWDFKRRRDAEKFLTVFHLSWDQ
jgi:hypothetical protein